MNKLFLFISMFCFIRSAAVAQNFQVLDFLKSISGEKTIAGQHNREPNSEPAKWTNEIYKTTGKYHGERLLGVDPESKKNVYTKLGPFGPMAQIGESTDEEKPRFAGLLKGRVQEGVLSPRI